MDNFGDSVGLVADWVAIKCWWQLDSPAACGGRGCSGHQPYNWQTSRLSSLRKTKIKRCEQVASRLKASESPHRYASSG